MTKATIVFRIVDDYLYNAGLLLSLMIVMVGVLLCLMAVLPRPSDRRSAPRLIDIDLREGSRRDG